MLTQIINEKIHTPQGWLKNGSVIISDNKILEVSNCDLAVVGAKIVDARGMYIVPGGVEIHVHGGAQYPFGGTKTYQVHRYWREDGCTGCLPPIAYGRPYIGHG